MLSAYSFLLTCCFAFAAIDLSLILQRRADRVGCVDNLRAILKNICKCA